MEKSVWSSKYRKLKVSGSFPRGRPRKTWSVVIRSNLIERKVNMEIAKDRNGFRSLIRNRLINARMENSPGGIYLFKVNNRNIRKRCEICSKLTIEAPEQHQYFTPYSSVSIFNFEHVIAGWDTLK